MSDRVVIQIYAFTSADDALEAIRLGVDQVGFVAGDYGIVNGELMFEQAASIARAVEGKAISVDLTMATDPAEIARMATMVRPDIVHISTDPKQVGAAALTELRDRLGPSVKLMKAIPIDGEDSFHLALEFAPCCDFLLLDSTRPGYPGVGATGATHDWAISRKIVDSVEVPVILAGGLDPGNVRTAIAQVHPWGVDSNTGTNLSGDPVRKDMDLIARFVKAVRGSGSADASD